MRRWCEARLALCLAAAVVAAEATPTLTAAYAKEVETARAERIARLTAPDGWLTLTGLHFLAAGDNTIGSARDNAIVFATGPAHLGKVTLAADGRLRIALSPAADARVNGRSVLVADLDYGNEGRATVVSCGTLSFFALERGGKRALRVRDRESVRRTQFRGLDYFPTDPAWRIEARWVALAEPREISLTNTLGQASPALVTGRAVFERDGKSFELLPIEDGVGGPLFFVISDLTSGKETYAAARFLYAEPPVDGKIVLDFNLAQNPPCAFTPFATCPLPPQENRLPLAVTAGEKDYRDGPE